MLLAEVLCLATGCEHSSSGNVRFENNSASKTVYVAWDGVRQDALAPGEKTDYMKANSGSHTLQWKNARNGRALTSIGWPNLVDGTKYTFPYND